MVGLARGEKDKLRLKECVHAVGPWKHETLDLRQNRQPHRVEE